jgi:Glycosyltransferase family 87
MKKSTAWMKGARIRYLLGISVAGMLCLHVLFLWNAWLQIQQGYGDFSIFYTAGKIVSNGGGAGLYDPAQQYSVQQEFAPNVSVRQGALPFNHPPFEALMFVPLTLLPYAFALAAWSAVNLALLLVVGKILRRRFSVLDGIAGWQWLAMELAFYPVFISLMQGQDSILLLCLYVFAFEGLERKADFSAGCCLGLGMFRFPLVLPMILIFLYWRRWRFVSGAVLVSLGLSLLSAWVVGFSGLLRYPRYVWHLEKTTGGGTILPGLMSNVRGLMASLLGGLVTPQTLLILTLLGSAFLLWIALPAGFARAAFDLKFALAIVVTVLVSYHSYSYDWCLLILPLVIVADHCARFRSGPPRHQFLPILPVVPLLISPLFFLLWLRWHNLSWLAIPLLVWLWAIRREIFRSGGLEETHASQS